MTPAQTTHILANARRIARARGVTAETVLAETCAGLLEDLGRIVPGMSPGYLRWNARHGEPSGAGKVRPAPIGVEVDEKKGGPGADHG